MRKNPCSPDCEGRNATCHSTCEQYLQWHKERNEMLDKAYKQRKIDEAISEISKRRH